MTDARDTIDRLAKGDQAATRRVINDPGDTVKSAEELTRESARQIFDRIKVRRDAGTRKGVKKTD